MDRIERPVSLVAQAEQALRRAIAAGAFPDGRLPAEVVLAERFGGGRTNSPPSCLPTGGG